MRELTPALTLSAGRPVVSSLKVAEHFQKQHQHVLRGINDLMSGLPDDFNASNFGRVEYLDAKGQKRPFYEMSRDGFTLVVMGFTGAKALAWKLRYIEAFNALEQELVRLAVASAERAGGQHQIEEPDNDGPAMLPDAVSRLKPGLRATAMHTAVQAARLTGGTEADIERLFLKYCGWLSPRPAPQAQDEAGRAATGWYAVFLGWTQECVTRSREAKTSSARLYDHFCRYMHEAHPEMLKPSMKEWGREMRARYLREKASTIYYHVLLPNAEGAVSLSRKWTLYPEAESTEQ
ncbi:MAG: Rha family transcriptional regulator [Humidesulfovibrio sp.]